MIRHATEFQLIVLYVRARSLIRSFAVCCIPQNSSSVFRIPFKESCALLLSIRSTAFIHIWPTDLFPFIVAMSQRFILFTVQCTQKITARTFDTVNM